MHPDWRIADADGSDLQVRVPYPILCQVSAANDRSLATVLGPVRAVVAGGCLTMLVMAAVTWRAPKLRRLDLGSYLRS